ncbi:MAG: hypothetical protein Q9195_009599 [Heterodermia aff. obscurata]
MISTPPPNTEPPQKSPPSKEAKRKTVGIACNECRAAKAKTVRLREVLSSLHDILRSDDAAVRRLQRKARENASLPSFIDDVAAGLEDPDQEFDVAPKVDAIILPLTLIHNASEEELLDLISRLRLGREIEDPQSIVEHHLHKRQTETEHRLSHEERNTRAASDAARNKSELDWDPLLRRRDHCEVSNLPSDDEAETEVSTMMDQEPPRAPRQMTATVAANWEKHWEQGRYPYPHPWNSLTPPIHIQGFGNLPFSSAIRANHYPAAHQWQQLINFSAHEYQVRSFALWEDSPIATLFYGFHDHAFQSIANGAPVSSILGPDIIDVELIFRGRTPDDPYDVCSWACEMWKSVVNFDIFVILASCVLASGLMRWDLFPTAENYALCPAMIRPTALQRFIPHSMPIDLVPHPTIRDNLIRDYKDWLTPGTVDRASTSVGWPFTLREAVEVHPVTGRRQVTPAFVAHATNPDNWSLNRSIERLCPDIEKEGFHLRGD